jgi:hypothetical protein
MEMKSITTKTRATITTSVGVMLLAAIGIFLLVNYFAGQGKFRAYWDWTSYGSNTLSDKTIGILNNLPAKLGEADGKPRVVEFASFLNPETFIESKAATLVHQLLDAYKIHGKGRIVVSKQQESEMANAMKKIKDLKLKEPPSFDQLIIAFGDRVRTVRLGDMVRINYGRGGRFMGGEDEPARIEEDKIEDTITTNLLAILDDKKPKIYFVTGHGEPDSAGMKGEGLSRFADLLRSNGYDVADLNLLEKDLVPADASLVVWIAPTRGAQPKELDALKQYCHEGGRFVISPDLPLEPGRDADVLALLAEYGVRSPAGFVCIPIENPFTGEQVVGTQHSAMRAFLRSADLSPVHPITRSFYEQKLSLPMPFARAFERITDSKTTAFTEDIGRTVKECWIDLEPVDFTNDPQKEPRGPKSLITAATLNVNNEKAANGSSLPESGAASRPSNVRNTEGRMVAIGSAMLARNEYFEFGRDLYLSAVEWVAGREYAAGIGARPAQKNTLIDINSLRPRIIGASAILTGLAFLAAGYVWYLRRGTRLGFILGALVAAFPLFMGIFTFAFSN